MDTSFKDCRYFKIDAVVDRAELAHNREPFCDENLDVGEIEILFSVGGGQDISHSSPGDGAGPVWEYKSGNLRLSRQEIFSKLKVERETLLKSCGSGYKQ